MTDKFNPITEYLKAFDRKLFSKAIEYSFYGIVIGAFTAIAFAAIVDEDFAKAKAIKLVNEYTNTKKKETTNHNKTHPKTSTQSIKTIKTIEYTNYLKNTTGAK